MRQKKGLWWGGCEIFPKARKWLLRDKCEWRLGEHGAASLAESGEEPSMWKKQQVNSPWGAAAFLVCDLSGVNVGRREGGEEERLQRLRHTGPWQTWWGLWFLLWVRWKANGGFWTEVWPDPTWVSTVILLKLCGSSGVAVESGVAENRLGGEDRGRGKETG